MNQFEDLDNLDLVTVGHGKPAKDKSAYGQALQIAGVKFEHGLGAHAVSLARIMLDGKAQKFHARGKPDKEADVQKSEEEHAKRVEAIQAAFVPMKHTLRIEPVN